jgi:NAD-dependent deacetylase
MTSSELMEAAARLRDAERVVVFTGAGVSAESGLPTFRTAENAMWKEVDLRNFAYPDGYRRNQPDAWRWYAARAETARRVEPNAGHYAIAGIERHVADFLLVTQNIDGLHQRAGSREVLELHGNLREVRCFDCGGRRAWSDVLSRENAQCDRCGGLLRPDVVMFEEELPPGALERAFEAARRCDFLLSVGTSNQVWPAADIPRHALRGGAHVAIVNPDLTGQPVGYRIIPLAGASGTVLPELVRLAFGGESPHA